MTFRALLILLMTATLGAAVAQTVHAHPLSAPTELPAPAEPEIETEEEATQLEPNASVRDLADRPPTGDAASTLLFDDAPPLRPPRA